MSSEKNKRKTFTYCVLCGRIEDGSSVHLFPKTGSIREKWAAYCGLEILEIKTRHSLCSKHFTAECYKESEARKILKLHAIPTVPIDFKNSADPAKLYCRSCILCGGNTDRSISYHRFPHDDVLRSLWAKFCDIKIEHIKNNHRLCSIHFTSNCINKARRLIANAIPSIHKLEENSEMQEWTPIQCKEDPEIQKGSLVPHKGNFKIQEGAPIMCKEEPETREGTPVPHEEDSEIQEATPVLHEEDFDIREWSPIPYKEEPEKREATLFPHKEDSGIPERTPIPETTPHISELGRKRKIRYVGDVTSPDLQEATLNRLKNYFLLAKKKIKHKERLIRSTRARVRRIITKMNTLKNTITQLRDENMVNADAAAQLIKFIEKNITDK